MLQARRLFSTEALFCPAHSTFLHRLGIKEPFDQVLQNVFYSCKDAPANALEATFNDLVHTGSTSLAWYVMKYTRARWPNLDTNGRGIAITVFSHPKNLASVARSLGSKPVIEGFPDVFIKESKEKPHEAAKKVITDDDIKKRLEDDVRHAQLMLALTGALCRMGVERSFIDSYLLGCHFDTNYLLYCLHPIVKLTMLLRRQGRLGEKSDLVFRIGRESGRATTDSMFMVGVFTSKKETIPLGEGR